MIGLVIIVVSGLIAAHNVRTVQEETLLEARNIRQNQEILKKINDTSEKAVENGAYLKAMLDMVKKILEEHSVLSDQIIANQASLKIDRRVVEELNKERIAELKAVQTNQIEILKELRNYEDAQSKTLDDVLRQLNAMRNKIEENKVKGK